MVKCLDKKWKEILFAASGFGPNFLMTLTGAYFTDAVNPAALSGSGVSGALQAISTGPLVITWIFPILWMIAKAFDGVIDVPMAAITDSLSTKWGRRRPPIAVCLPIMMISFAMFWMPFGSQTFNTVWIFIFALIFFTSYTMCLIAFYGSLAYCCSSSDQLLKVSSLKAFFDTISYCIVYALVPLLLQVFNIHIDTLALCAIPLMLTMLIPLFIIKEGEKYGYPENKGLVEEKIPLSKSLRITFKNKLFRKWLIVNCCSFFGLQMFLSAMNALIVGGMGMSNADMAILNTAAFAPVPIMLYLFNKITEKKGLRFGVQLSLLTFAIAILNFLFTNKYIVGDNRTIQFVLGIAGGILGSFSIGAFFMVPYIIPSQLASVEEKVTGRNHAAMYFAAQALVTTVVGAIASGLVYENIKMLFISKEAGGIVRAESYEQAAQMLQVSEGSVYKFGLLLVPIIVSVACLVGFFLAFRMPKNFSIKEVAASFQDADTSLDLEAMDNEDEGKIEKESVFVNVALWFLSGSLFGFIWQGFTQNKISKLTGEHKTVLWWLLCTFVPFVSIAYLIRSHKKLQMIASEKHVRLRGSAVLYAVLGILFPILPVNVISLSVLTHDAEALLD